MLEHLAAPVHHLRDVGTAVHALCFARAETSSSEHATTAEAVATAGIPHLLRARRFGTVPAMSSSDMIETADLV